MRVHLGLRLPGEGQSSASALANRQSAAAPQPVGMHRARAQPRRPRHALLILLICTISPAHTFTLLRSETSSQRTEQYLVCRELVSSLCLSWKIESEDLIEPPNNIIDNCGLSDLKPVPPHRKFIKITSLSMNAPVKMSFCSTTNVILVKNFDWKSADTVHRVRRQTGYTPRGRFRGQTQSQYLAINDKSGKEEGKAEAHSAGDSSRASVSGKSGMGQAQSQSVYDPSCDECYGQSEPGAESLKRKPFGSTQFGTGPYGPGRGAISGGTEPYGTDQIGKPGGSGTVSRPYGPGQGGATGGTGPYGPGQGDTTGGTVPYGPGQGGTTGGAGPYGPGQGGTTGGTVPYGPGQGGTTGGAGPYGPGQGGTTGGTVPYGPGQGGTTGGAGPYGHGQGGTTGGTVPYGPSQGGTTGGAGPYGPGQGSTTGGIVPYGPGQGGTTGGTGPYGPGQGGTTGGIVPYGPGQAGTTGVTRPYGPGQGGTTGTISYGPGQIGGPGTNGPFGPRGTTGGTVPYGTDQGGTTGGTGPQGPGQGIGSGGAGSYGPSQGGGSGGNGPYRINQGGGPSGNIPYGPSQGVPLGGIGSYGPIQGGGSGAIGLGQGGGTGGAGSYRPDQITPGSTGPYGQSQSNIPGATGSYSPNQGGPYGNNWPLVTAGVIPGVGTNPTYFCCVVGPNNTPQYVGLGGSNFRIPANVGQTGFNIEPNSRGNGQQPNQVFVPGGSNVNYPGYTGSTGGEPYNIGKQNVPFNTVTGSSQNNLKPLYNTGTGTYEPESNLGPSNLQIPNGRYGTGAVDNQGNIPYGTGSVHGPNGSYDRGTIGGQNVNGPSGSSNIGGPNNLITPTGPYGSDLSGGQKDFRAPNTQYGTGSIGGQPNGQYNTNTGGGQNGLPIPNNQYGTGNIPNAGTGTTTGAGGSNGPYNTGSYGEQNGPYGTGSTGVQNGIPYGVQTAGQQFPGPGTTYGQGVNGNIGPNGSGTGETPSVGSNGGQYGNEIYDYNNQRNTGVNNANGGGPQNVIDPNSIAGSLDGDDSDALASVSQDSNGTVASASSKGGNDKSRAQTQVEGKYTGNGSFSAQAQITDESKGAESQVSGGKQGASSNAQGRGRNNKSQASVQLGSETGSLQTQAQSDGSMHSSNSQVQGSVKGGMADAQARGPGSTSSQAQIGFTPYKDGDKSHELLKTPFVGGGTASAQSSGRTGQSQSQLQGTFKYGITYNGAAQSGSSIDKDAVFSNRLPFNKIDVFDETNKNIDVDTEITTEVTSLPEINFDTNVTTSEAKPSDNDESMKNSESRYSSHSHSDHHKPDNPTLETASPSPTSNRRSFQANYSPNGADYEYTTDKEDIPTDDYEQENSLGPGVNDPAEFEYPNSDENYSKEPEVTHQSLYNPTRKGLDVKQSTGGNTQHIVLGSIKDHDAIITQKNTEQRPEESRIYQPGERVPGTGGYTIPIGFTGSIKSVASKDKTYVVGTKDSPSQAQTISLTPGSGKVKYVYPKLDSTYRRSVKPKHLKSLYNPKSDDSNRYVSVSKSVTGALDGDNNVRKQYSHTYYTKSSSCGYFTFSCTIVSGTNGRKKVCKPKIPTNPDGTPMRC